MAQFNETRIAIATSAYYPLVQLLIRLQETLPLCKPCLAAQLEADSRKVSRRGNPVRAVWLAGQSSVGRPSHCHPAQAKKNSTRVTLSPSRPIIHCNANSPFSRLLRVIFAAVTSLFPTRFFEAVWHPTVSVIFQQAKRPWPCRGMQSPSVASEIKMESALGRCSLQAEAGGHQPLAQGFRRVPPARK